MLQGSQTTSGIQETRNNHSEDFQDNGERKFSRDMGQYGEEGWKLEWNGHALWLAVKNIRYHG